ncbi:hypothetical protein P885DRAFT_61215 [Corynascus similis CBS 632.67]
MAEQTQLLVSSTAGGTVSANWRAVIVLQTFVYDDLPVPQDHLVQGAIYRTIAEKISDLQALSELQLKDTLRNWSMTGSALDHSVKALWISIRAQRSQLEFLGIDPKVAKFMFDWEFFIPSVDKVLRLLRDRFRNAMNTPDQTLPGLIAMCDKQTSTWPENGKGVIYVRAYTHLDPGQTDANNTGLYVGTPEAQAMAEQTVMLMLKSYAPWVETWPDELEPYSQRARLLVKVEQRSKNLRVAIKFPGPRVGPGIMFDAPFDLKALHMRPGDNRRYKLKIFAVADLNIFNARHYFLQSNYGTRNSTIEAPLS